MSDYTELPAEPESLGDALRQYAAHERIDGCACCACAGIADQHTAPDLDGMFFPHFIEHRHGCDGKHGKRDGCNCAVLAIEPASLGLGDALRSLLSTDPSRVRERSEAFPDGLVPIYDATLGALAAWADALTAERDEARESYHEAVLRVGDEYKRAARAEAERDRLAAFKNQVLKPHQPYPSLVSPGLVICRRCNEPWPCQTAAAAARTLGGEQ